MKVLIKNAGITDAFSPYNKQVQDILIQDGIISKIADFIDEDSDKIIEIPHLEISPGWVDCFAHFCDPGFEYKETVTSGANAAAAGGFTEVMVIPDTQPTISGKTQVEYLITKSTGLPVRIHPIGGITKNLDGKELNEMYDMFHTGAVAFSDGMSPIQSAGMLQKALEYLVAIDTVIIQLPDDHSIGSRGLINEGETSTLMGLPGKPALSEELMISRDIELARYTGSKIHFTGVSTKKSLQLIAEAKKENLKVSCSVTPYHLFFCEEDLKDYDTNLKVNPPLRTKEDRAALREGIADGTIDFIASHHQPQDWDHKVCEFEYAKNGMEGLESVFSVARTCGISTETFVKMQSENIRKIFNLPSVNIDIGNEANLSFFLSDETFTFEEAQIHSKSKNNAFIGHLLKGKPMGIINGKKLFLSNHKP